MSLPGFSTRYPTTIAMATLAILLLGWISVDRLGTDLLPDLTTPVVTVDLRAPGISLWEMEERYTRRLERDIQTVSKVRRVYSVTRAGQSVVVAEFAWEADMDFAVLDVQKKTATFGADEAVETVDVIRQDPHALPVLRLAVSAVDTDIDALLGTIQTVIKPKLEGLPGVASAVVEGGAEKEVRVILDDYLMEAYGQTPGAVAQRLQLANRDVSGGTLKDAGRSYQVKGLGRLTDIEAIRELIVGERSGETTGSQSGLRVPIRVSDIAKVELRLEERESISRLDGVECVGLAIHKEASANTVTVVETARTELEDLSLDLPGIQFTIVENQARFIDAAVSEVEESALAGGLLAVAVLFLFLRSWAVTLLIGLAIPISVLATFTLMYFQDLTLNVMSLGGLALGVGMLVDNAIVVIENIYRHLERGEDARTAAADGASEVGVAILASTLTTVSVFLPIVYLHGLVGELFKEQAWTVAFSLISSLAVAMTVVPTMAARVMRHDRARVASNRHAWFARLLEGALDRKAAVLSILVLVVGLTVTLGRMIDAEFIPREDQGLFHVDLALPEGTRVEITDRVAARSTEIVRGVGAEDVDHVYARVGVDPGSVLNVGEATGPNRATLSVLLSRGERAGVSELVAGIDPLLKEIPGLRTAYALHQSPLETVMGTQSAPIEVEVTGDDLDVLRALVTDVTERVTGLSTVFNVQNSFEGGQPEVDLVLRQEVAAAFGLTPQTIVNDLTRRLSGEVVGEFAQGRRSRSIRVGFDDVNLQDLRAMRVDGPDDAILTVGDLADPKIVEGPREILREDQRRVGRVTGYLTEGTALGEATADVTEVLSDLPLPPGYRVTLGGEERERVASFEGLAFALLLSVILVYMVMASLFESFLHPFTVMLSLPLAGVGVVFAFLALGEPLSVTAYIGVIMLGGIAVNDSIVLVDRINQLRVGSSTTRRAIVDAARDRLRPILMTSVTTMLALVPMAIGLGEGGRLRAPMAIAVIAGLLSSTVMTLVVIPVFYESIERLRGAR